MPIALSGRSLGAKQPLEEDIRLAAVNGIPWLVLDAAKMQAFLDAPEFDIRDLKRLFLRVQPAAVDGLIIDEPDPGHLPLVEAYCKDARRINAPVLVVRCERPDMRLAACAEVAQRWSTVLALVPPTGQLGLLAALLDRLDHPALGFYIDVVELHRGGETLARDIIARVVMIGVGDESVDGYPVLPGHGIVPVAPLLAPLQEAGFQGLYVLDVPIEEPATDAQNWVLEGRKALLATLSQIGWRDEAP